MSGGSVSSDAVQVVVGGVPARPAARVESEPLKYRDPTPSSHTESKSLPVRSHDRKAPGSSSNLRRLLGGLSLRQKYPGYRFFCLENYRVLKGIVFDDSLADDHVLLKRGLKRRRSNCLRCAEFGVRMQKGALSIITVCGLRWSEKCQLHLFSHYQAASLVEVWKENWEGGPSV